MQQIALVVDDSRVARMTLSKLLVAHDLEVVELASGEDALAYLKSDNVNPDIIFMDVMMGGMDGLTATQEIKADNNLKHIPIVVCTGHDTDADRDKAISVGAISTLTKPPKADAIDAIIDELAQQIVKAPSKEVAQSAMDSETSLAKLMTLVEQNLLPTMQQELRDIAKIVSRQVAIETAEQRLTEQVELLRESTHEPVATADEKTLLANVMSAVEQDLLPKLNHTVREAAEDISRQVASDTAEQVVSEQVQLAVDGLLPALQKQVLAESQQVTERLANSITKHAAHEAVANSAEKAVQNAIEEFNVSQQVTMMLNTEGEVWLQRQQQKVIDQLMQQIEAKFAPMVLKYLNDHITQMIAPIAHTIVDEAFADMDTHSDNSELNELSQQISTLKMTVMGLGAIVLVLAVAIIF